MLKQKMKIAGACLGGICLAVAMTGTALAATYTITYDASTDGQGLFLPENTEILTQTKESGETVKISDRTPAGKDMGHLVAIGLDTDGGVLLSGTSNFQYIYGIRSYFDKWTDDREGNGNVYTAGQDYMKDANLTLYAQWKYVRKDESTPLPDVKRDGYELLGWYDSYENGNFLGMPGDEVELENLSVIFATSARRQLDTDQFSTLVLALSDSYDHIIIDTDCSDESIDCLSGIAMNSIVISTSDPSGTRDARYVCDRLYSRNVPGVKVLFNRVRKDYIADKITPNLDYAMDTVGVPLAGVVPELPDIVRCTSRGIAPKSNSMTQKIFKSIASRLDGESVPLTVI